MFDSSMMNPLQKQRTTMQKTPMNRPMRPLMATAAQNPMGSPASTLGRMRSNPTMQKVGLNDGMSRIPGMNPMANFDRMRTMNTMGQQNQMTQMPQLAGLGMPRQLPMQRNEFQPLDQEQFDARMRTRMFPR